MPSSSSARMTRTAISPRLATRTLENMAARDSTRAPVVSLPRMDERFLVTGSGGCIGAWVVAQLVGEGTGVVALDASDDDHRLRLLLSGDELAELTRVKADITELE